MPLYLHFSTFISVCVFPCYAYVFISLYNGYTLSLLYLEVKQKHTKGYLTKSFSRIVFISLIYQICLEKKKHETDVVWGNRRLV